MKLKTSGFLVSIRVFELYHNKRKHTINLSIQSHGRIQFAQLHFETDEF